MYIPGDKDRALEKARGLPTDAILFDLEDAVAQGSKAAARETLAKALIDGGYGLRACIVRINDFGTEWGASDLDVVARAGPEAILLPKVGDASDIEDLARRLDAIPEAADTRIWAMMETPEGVLNAARIATAPRMAGIVMGTNDLAKDLRVTAGADRAELSVALQTSVIAARAAGLVILDGVYNAFKDTDGLARECAQGRAMGFDGKSLIHPAQLDTANRIFAPTETEVDLARRQIAAYEAALAEGAGVAVVDGKIVENLHIETAKRVLAQVEAIATMEPA